MPKDTFFRLPLHKKKRIEEGAIETFNRLSYDQVTVADIIYDCDIPRGSFYMYFENKFDLFNHLLQVIQQDKMTFMAPVLNRMTKEPFIKLYPSLFKAGLDFARSYPKFYRLGYHLFYSQEPDMIKMQEHFMALGVSMLAEYVKGDQRSGYIREDIDATIVATMLHQLNARDVMAMFYEGKEDDEIIRFVDEILKIIRYGIEREDENGKSI